MSFDYLLPSTWRWATLSEIATPEKNSIADGPFGSNLKTSDYVDKGIPVLQGKNITNNIFFWKDIRFISEIKSEELKRSQVRVGDLLMIKIGSIGYAAIVDDLNGFECAVIPANMAKISIDRTKVFPKYLWFWMTSADTVQALKRLASKTAQPAISLEKIKPFPIPLPSLPIQVQIADILEKADQLRKDCQKMEQELNNLAQSVFIDMFGDPVTNPKGWDVLPLRDIISGGLQNGAYYPKEDYSNTGVEMVHMSDVFYDFVPRGQMKRVNASLKDIEKYRLTSRDLLISRRSLMLEGAAKPSLIQESNEDLIFESSMIRLTPDSEKVTVKYLFYYLSNPLVKSNYIFQYVTGATIKGINQANLEKVSILVPDLKLQRKFDLIEEKIRNQKESLRELANKYSDNFNSLMQKAFKGELNLKNKAA